MRISLDLGLAKRQFPLGTPLPTSVVLTVSQAGRVVFTETFAGGLSRYETDAPGVPPGAYVVSVQALAEDGTFVGEADSRSVDLAPQTVEVSLPTLAGVSVS